MVNFFKLCTKNAFHVRQAMTLKDLVKGGKNDLQSRSRLPDVLLQESSSLSSRTHDDLKLVPRHTSERREREKGKPTYFETIEAHRPPLGAQEGNSAGLFASWRMPRCADSLEDASSTEAQTYILVAVLPHLV